MSALYTSFAKTPLASKERLNRLEGELAYWQWQKKCADIPSAIINDADKVLGARMAAQNHARLIRAEINRANVAISQTRRDLKLKG